MAVYKTEPIYRRTIWAGNKLARLRGRQDQKEGTCWELSVHPSAQSVVSQGKAKGRTLASLIEENPEGMLGKGFTEKELLRLAWLDAGDPLSVQVHPGETYAMVHEKDHGKTESWYILEADEGARLVLGSRYHSKEEIRESIKNDTIEQGLTTIPVKAGDFVLVPSGTLHALGKGILAIEIGTNSNTTYRFYDYHRRDEEGKERELHLEKSLDVVNFENRGGCVHNPLDHIAKVKRIADFPEYFVDLIDIEGEYILPAWKKSFRTISCLDGDFVLEEGNETTALEHLRSAFISADGDDIILHGTGRIMVGTPKKRKEMEVIEPVVREDFSSAREDAMIESGVKKLKDLRDKFFNCDGVKDDLVLYEVRTEGGDPEIPGSLRYGLTTLMPVTVNGECAFTRGHWHEDETVEEIYMGLSGTGLLMYMDHNGSCWCEKVSPGSVHHIAGSLAHRLINTGDVPMKVKAVWNPCAGHNYDAVEAMPFPYRVFKDEEGVKIIPHE